MTHPDVEVVKATLVYDQVTGIFTRRDGAKFNKAGRNDAAVGVRDSRGYLLIRIGKRKFMAHRLAWLYVHGRWPEGDIDHINRVIDDNRIVNLREATRSQNMANSCVPVTNKSGHKGVCLDKATGRWLAYMQVDGKFRNLGRHETLEGAISAREVAFKAEFGQFARIA